MDPIRNPYAPGAGTPPPELAGRQEVLESARIAIERARLGRPTKSLLLVGLRAVGKTVLLDRIREDAEVRGIYALRVEAPENRSLPSILAPQLRTELLRLSTKERAKDLAQRALRGLSGFARALKVKYQDIEVSLDLDPEPGLADNGDLESDLQDLLRGCWRCGQGRPELSGDLRGRAPVCEGRGTCGAYHRAAPCCTKAATCRHGRGRPAAVARAHGQGQVLR